MDVVGTEDCSDLVNITVEESPVGPRHGGNAWGDKEGVEDRRLYKYSQSLPRDAPHHVGRWVALRGQLSQNEWASNVATSSLTRKKDVWCTRVCG